MYQRKAVHEFNTLLGLTVRVYRIKTEDAHNLVNLFQHLSVASRYQRFNEALIDPDPDFVWQTAQRMATVDEKLGAAWIAFADLPGEPNAPVAGARYIRSVKDFTSAEVSIAVRDDLQHQGLGSQLLRYLAHHARTHGVKQFVGSFDTNNRAVWKLVRDAPFETSTTVNGIETDVIVDLTTPIGNLNDWLSSSLRSSKEATMVTSTLVTTFRLDNGLELHIRPQSEDDLGRMVELFERVSPERRLERAGVTTTHQASDQALKEATRLVHLNSVEGRVWLVFADLPGHPNTLVASGRFMRCSPTEGEMSVVVRDDMQGQGIGGKLFYFVLDQARALGITRMSSCFASDNEAVWQILSYSPYHVTWQARGKQVEIMIYLQPAAAATPSLN